MKFKIFRIFLKLKCTEIRKTLKLLEVGKILSFICQIMLVIVIGLMAIGLSVLGLLNLIDKQLALKVMEFSCHEPAHFLIHALILGMWMFIIIVFIILFIVFFHWFKKIIMNNWKEAIKIAEEIR